MHSYRVSRFSLSATARISTKKHPRVCVSGCKRVSESHCEAPGIYNYRAGVLFQQDCEVNKPAREERKKEKDEKGWRKREEGTRAHELRAGIAPVGRPTERARGGESGGGGDAPIVMERTDGKERERERRRNEPAINFGREECGAHVRPGYALGGE